MSLFRPKTAKRQLTDYDWRLDGEPATFCVDLSLYDTAPDERYPILAYVGCCSLEDEKALGSREIRAIESFMSALRRKLGFVLAGFIDTDRVRQYYLYLSSREDLDLLRQLAERAKGFRCRIGAKAEKDWASYFRILYPDAAKFQTIRNDEMIWEHYKLGDSEAPRRLNLHFAFKNDPDCICFAEAARQEGFAIGASEEYESDELPCGVVIHRICAFVKADIDTVTIQAIRIAEGYGGKLLFWDCPIVPERA